ncbi:lipocalin [Salipiger aestuarii]|uniref:Sulfur transporter n=1 Tax=Salipiger aestuarii TaxID=568098 RepID=A0A327XQB5_9RHOB|nr:YeeE/YedE family protein [Salipiger aestuarii]KAB2538584.1 lipocalin [Salipiger aestuarii]RAK09475.1 sulfur transporter [Salipiger aestuarii]
MDLVTVVDGVGENATAALCGLATGVVFGVAAQRSRFCLRAAVVEFANGAMKHRVAVWLLTFSTALVWVQGAQLLGLFDSANARMMAVSGSWSGAIVGGLMFGAGMVLANGCSGRLLVMAATGNLRSVISGMIFAVVAQMSLSGILSPLRDRIAALWVTAGGRNMDLLAAAHLPPESGLAIGLGIALLALGLSLRHRIGTGRLVFASGVGFAVALGWMLTFALSNVAFEPVQIESATFTGPSAHTLMFFLDRGAVLDFDVGLVPGVFLGAFVAAAWAGELKVQGFDGPSPLRNAMIGAALMGFGGMLAGGCAIGAGVTGASILAGTAWLALLCMWIGGTATVLLTGGRRVAAM